MANFAIQSGAPAEASFLPEFPESAPDQDQEGRPQFQESLDLMTADELAEPLPPSTAPRKSESDPPNPWALLFTQQSIWIAEPVQPAPPPMNAGGGFLRQPSALADGVPATASSPTTTPRPSLDDQPASSVEMTAIATETDVITGGDSEIQPAGEAPSVSATFPASLASRSAQRTAASSQTASPGSEETRMSDEVPENLPSPDGVNSKVNVERAAPPAQTVAETLPPPADKVEHKHVPDPPKDRIERDSFSSRPMLGIRNRVPSKLASDNLAFEVELSDGESESSSPLVDVDQDIPDAAPLTRAVPRTKPEGSDDPQTQVQQSEMALGREEFFVAGQEDKRAAPPTGIEHLRQTAVTPESRGEPPIARAAPAPEPAEASGLRRAMEVNLPEATRSNPGFTRVQVQLDGPNENVRVQVAQIAGNVRVAVHSADSALVNDLQSGLPEVIAGIEEGGVSVQTHIPENGSPIATEKQSAISQNMQGNLQWSHEGPADSPPGYPSGRQPRHRRPDQQWQEWLEER